MKCKVLSAIGCASTLEDEFASRMFAAISFITIQHLVEQHHFLADHRGGALTIPVMQTILFLVALYSLRQKSAIDFPVLRDLQDISIYGLILQVVVLSGMSNISSLPVLKQISILHSVYGSLCFIRLLWPAMNDERNAFTPWPAFGILGFLAWRKAQSRARSKPMRLSDRLSVYVAIALSCGMGLLTHWFEFAIEEACICLVMLIILTSQAIPVWTHIKNRERALEAKCDATQCAAEEAHRRFQEREAQLCGELEQVRRSTQESSAAQENNSAQALTEGERDLLAHRRKIPAYYMAEFSRMLKQLAHQFSTPQADAEIIAFPKKEKSEEEKKE